MRRSSSWRWRIVLGVTLLVAVVPYPAVAQIRATSYLWFIGAKPARAMNDLCVGDSVRIAVTAGRGLLSTRVVEEASVNLYGITIDGSSSDPAIGSISPERRNTSARGSPSGSVTFTFKANKAGATRLRFTGFDPNGGYAGGYRDGYLPAQFPVTVLDCAYQVTSMGRWTEPYVSHFASIDSVKLSSTETPGHFTGTGTWTFTILNHSPHGCPTLTQVYSGAIDIEADEIGRDELELKITHGPATGWSHLWLEFECYAFSESERYLRNPEPVTITVPAAGGSVSNRPTTLVDGFSAFYDLLGPMSIRVTRLSTP
jgi:hypothetical protein